MTDASNLRSYLAGWDDAVACTYETLSWIPDEQVAEVLKLQRRRREQDALAAQLAEARRNPPPATTSEAPILASVKGCWGNDAYPQANPASEVTP